MTSINYKVLNQGKKESEKVRLKREIMNIYPNSGPVFSYMSDKLIHTFGEKYPKRTMEMIERVAKERGTQ